MRSWILRFLALLGVAGSGIWIGTSPHEVEPYVTMVGAIAGVLAMFRDRPKANVTMSFRPQGEHIQAFVFENIGDADATNLDMKFFFKEGQAEPVYQHETGLPLAILYPHHRHLVRGWRCHVDGNARRIVEIWEKPIVGLHSNTLE